MMVEKSQQDQELEATGHIIHTVRKQKALNTPVQSAFFLSLSLFILYRIPVLRVHFPTWIYLV